MKIFRTLFILFCCLSITGCNTKSINELNGSWVYDYGILLDSNTEIPGDKNTLITLRNSKISSDSFFDLKEIALKEAYKKDGIQYYTIDNTLTRTVKGYGSISIKPYFYYNSSNDSFSVVMDIGFPIEYVFKRQ